MGVPVFLAQVLPSATDTIQSGGGSVQTLDLTRYYFYFSSKSAASDGQSLLVALKTKADASSGVAWTLVLDANLKLKVTHNAGGTTNLILNRGLAWNLGFAKVFGDVYPPNLGLTEAIPVPAGAGGYTAEYRSSYLWCPEMRVSATGPQMFDAMTSPGVRVSAGTSSRAPDMTPSFTKNGEQVDAKIMFTAVEGLYRAREPDLSYGADPHEREAYETFWRINLSEGKRLLFWRDKSQLTGLSFGTGIGTSAPNYVEYVPDSETRAEPQMAPASPDDLYYWNITVGLWLTERGTAVY